MLAHYTNRKYSHWCHLKRFSQEKFHPSFIDLYNRMGVPSIRRDFHFYWKLIAVLHSHISLHAILTRYGVFFLSLYFTHMIRCDSFDFLANNKFYEIHHNRWRLCSHFSKVKLYYVRNSSQYGWQYILCTIWLNIKRTSHKLWNS